MGANQESLRVSDFLYCKRLRHIYPSAVKARHSADTGRGKLADTKTRKLKPAVQVDQGIVFLISSKGLQCQQAVWWEPPNSPEGSKEGAFPLTHRIFINLRGSWSKAGLGCPGRVGGTWPAAPDEAMLQSCWEPVINSSDRRLKKSAVS